MRLSLLLPLIFVALPLHAREALDLLAPSEIERALLAKFSQVSRNGTTLAIRTSGNSIEFVDSNAAPEQRASYFLVGSFPLSTERTDFLVKGQYWEGSNYTLVNGKTGAKCIAAGPPTLSTNLKWYLSIAYPGEDSDGPRVVEVIDANSLQVVHRIDYGAIRRPYSGPVVGKWIQANEALILRRIVEPIDSSSRSGQLRISHEPFILKLSDGQWIQEKL